MINVGEPKKTYLSGAIAGLIAGQVMIPVDFVNPDFNNTLTTTIAEITGLIGYLFGHALFSIIYGLIFTAVFALLIKYFYKEGMNGFLFFVYAIIFGVVIAIIAYFGFPLLGNPTTPTGFLYILGSHEVYAVATAVLYMILIKNSKY